MLLRSFVATKCHKRYNLSISSLSGYILWHSVCHEKEMSDSDVATKGKKQGFVEQLRIRLPEELDQRLLRLAESKFKTKAECAREAILAWVLKEEAEEEKEGE